MGLSFVNRVATQLLFGVECRKPITLPLVLESLSSDFAQRRWHRPLFSSAILVGISPHMKLITG